MPPKEWSLRSSQPTRREENFPGPDRSKTTYIEMYDKGLFDVYVLEIVIATPQPDVTGVQLRRLSMKAEHSIDIVRSLALGESSPQQTQFRYFRNSEEDKDLPFFSRTG